MKPDNQKSHKVEVLDLDSSEDRQLYTEILSKPDVTSVANETHITKTGEKLIVLKYTEDEESPDIEDFRTPIFGF